MDVLRAISKHLTCKYGIWPFQLKARPFWPLWPWNIKILKSPIYWHQMVLKTWKNHWFFSFWPTGLYNGLYDLCWPFLVFKRFLMAYEAIITEKCPIETKIWSEEFLNKISWKQPQCEADEKKAKMAKKVKKAIKAIKTIRG